jgi:VWFA-related protein
MTIKKFIFTILIINLVLFLFSQYASAREPGGSDKQGNQDRQESSRLTYEVDVRVTKVDVIVTDKAGKRVTGLKPENFRIYEDGRPRRLTTFYEVKGMDIYVSGPEEESGKLSQPSPPPPQSTAPQQVRNKIIIYFDNRHLHPMNRNWGIKKLESFIRNNFPPDSNNEGMVVCLDQKLEILRKFTSNPRLLTLAIEEVKKRSGQSLLRRKEREELRRELNRTISETNVFDKSENYNSYVMALGQARNYVESEQNDLLFSLKSLSAFINNLTGMEGRKILIYVSDGLPINPGDEVFSFLGQAFPSTNARVEAMNYDATRRFKELTARCNANEIALYPINARGLENMTLSADSQSGWDVSRRGPGMIKSVSRRKNDALKLMAQDTGGLAILNTNDIEKGLERIENDLQFYYTLAYRSLYREDNKYHSIRVKLVGVEEKYDVRVRQGYKQISRDEKIKENVSSRLFLTSQYNPMGVIVQILPVKKMLISDKLQLTLKLLIPIKNLVLKPRKEKNDYFGQIRVYTILKDAEGLISPVRELSEEIKIPAKDYEIAIKSNYPYLVEMYVDPGHYTISLAVRDVYGADVSYIQGEKTISGK